LVACPRNEPPGITFERSSVAFVFFGRVHDLTGSYDVALTVGAAAFCAGAAAFASMGLLGDRPHQRVPVSLL
jgi:hypothetical protein